MKRVVSKSQAEETVSQTANATEVLTGSENIVQEVRLDSTKFTVVLHDVSLSLIID